MFSKLFSSSREKNQIPEVPKLDGTYDFIAIDVETANSNSNSICQIAIVGVKNEEHKVLYSSLIKPPNNDYSPINIGVHGIHSSDTESALSFDKVWYSIEPIFKNTIVAHNASFDVSRVIETLKFYDLPIPNIKSECTYQLTGLKLPEACKSYGISLENHHNAESDAMACALLYLAVRSGKKRNMDSVEKKEDKKKTSLFEHKRIDSDLLQPIDDAPDNYLNGKIIVFTGDLQKLSRKEAAQKARSLGADVNVAISGKTDFVVVGNNPGPSKVAKIKKLMEKGKKIKVLKEEEFIKYLL